MKHNYERSFELFNTSDNTITEVKISTATLYGCFERYRIKKATDVYISEGGLWFDQTKRGGGLVLIDSDVTYCLPADVAYLLRENGVIVPEEFD